MSSSLPHFLPLSLLLVSFSLSLGLYVCESNGYHPAKWSTIQISISSSVNKKCIVRQESTFYMLLSQSTLLPFYTEWLWVTTCMGALMESTQGLTTKLLLQEGNSRQDKPWLSNLDSSSMPHTSITVLPYWHTMEEQHRIDWLHIWVY